MISKTRFTEKGLFISLLLLSFFPIYPYSVISITTFLFIAISIFTFVINKSKPNRKALKSLLMFTGYFIILSLSALYSSNFDEAIKQVTRLIPLLLIPLALFFLNTNPLSGKDVNRVKWCFITSSIILSLYILIRSIYLQLTSNDWFYNYIKLVGKEDLILDFHPTYISMFFIMSIFLMIDYGRERKKHNPFVYILVLFLGVMILLLASRIMILSLLIAAILYIPKKRFKLVFIGLFIATSVLLINYVGALKHQYEDVIKSKLELPEEKFPSSINVRYGINYCSWGIIKNNFLLGIGVGDFQKGLNDCYETLETKALSRQNYNSHNFYFFLWGSAGILSVLAFLGLITHQIFYAVKSKQKLQLVFWMIILFGSITESILVRSYGITFFVFFITLFYLTNNNESSLNNNTHI